MHKLQQPEVWLRGPLQNIPALLQPVAHALLQAREEINEMLIGFPDGILWVQVAGMASVGFHLQHLTGVLDRLFTYAKGQQLNDDQLNYLAAEGNAIDVTVAQLLATFNKQVDKAIAHLSLIDESI